MEIPVDWEELMKEQISEITKDEPEEGSPERERPNDYMWQSREDEKLHQDEIEEELNEWAELY